MRNGGLLVAPAAPALAELATNAGYREALLSADLAIADSGFMVLVWNLLERGALRKLSGLEVFARTVERARPPPAAPGLLDYEQRGQRRAQPSMVGRAGNRSWFR